MRVLLLLASVGLIVCPPVQKPQEKTVEDQDDGVDQLLYNRYLQEVVNILEKDPEFRKKLENANASHIKTNEFAMELDFVNHQIRQELDEAKRLEIKRLIYRWRTNEFAMELDFVNHQIRQELDEAKRQEIKRLKDLFRRRDGLESEPGHNGHLDVANTDTFEIDDLKKLIQKTTQDLEEIDRKRRDEFKNYEMKKEHNRQEGMKGMDEEHKKAAEKQHEDDVKKHKDHPKLHHPGSKDQFKDVWENEDHLDRDNFDTKTFFMQHDIDNDGYWNEEEVEALFQLELQKLYEANHTEDDLNEKYEEMYRMREHLVGEMDKNKDKMVSKEEYDTYVQTKEFEKDEGWEGIDDTDQYTDEEFAEYEKMMEGEELKRSRMDMDGHAQPGEINIPHDENVQQMDKGPSAPQ